MKGLLHSVGINEGAGTLYVCDLVLAEKALNTLGERANNSVLVFLGLAPIVSDTSGIDPEGFKLMGEFVELVGDVEEGLRGDAAHVQTGSSQSASLLDADGVQTQLRCLDCRHIAFFTEELPPGPPPITARSKVRFEKA